MAFIENISLFFDTTYGHAVTGTIKTSAGATVRTAPVIWTNALQPLQLFDAQIEAAQPSLLIQTADLAGVVVGSHTITVGAVTYRIVERVDGGTGTSTLKVRK